MKMFEGMHCGELRFLFVLSQKRPFLGQTCGNLLLLGFYAAVKQYNNLLGCLCVEVQNRFMEVDLRHIKRYGVIITLFVFMITVASTVTAHAQTSQEGNPQTTQANVLTPAEFEQWITFIDSLVAKQRFSGVVRLVSPDGRVKFHRAYGLARRKPDVPNRLNTQFNIASMGKMFTAVAILQLMEQGKLSLDDPISKHAPGIMRDEVASKIRIKHLLNHSSGLENLATLALPEWHQYLPFLEMMKLSEEQPGTKYDYNDWNYVALGAIIERLTGEDYFAYTRKRIWKPAGMSLTGPYMLGRLPEYGAIGYYSTGPEDLPLFGTRWFRTSLLSTPFGGAYSTAEDLHRFFQALHSGKLLRPVTVKMMMSPKPELNNNRYGYGVQYFLDGKLVGHSGGEDVGALDAWALQYPESGYFLVVLSNLRTNLGDESTARPIVVKLLDFLK
jgi:CubicO group peptidase (beta-lactamase class C family)